MSILWADNFDNYGTDETKLTDGIYAEVTAGVTLETDPDVNATGRCIKVGQNNDSTPPRRGRAFRWVYPTAVATAGVAFRIWMDDLPVSLEDSFLWTFSDINNDGQVVLKVLSDGSIRAYRGDIGLGATEPATTLGTTSSPALTAGAWNHVEIKVLLSDTAGTVEVRVNGITVLDLSSLDTIEDAGATVSQFLFSNADLGNGGGFYYIKDFIAWDTTGTQNNDFLGTVHVYTLTPDADDTLNWDVSTGLTGYDLIDETTPDDTDYISADNTPPSASVFTLSDLPPDIVSVKALIPIVRATKTDGGDGNVQMGLISNASTDLGTDRPITSAYTYWWDVSELSPDTGVAYTPIEVDSVKWQIDRTT